MVIDVIAAGLHPRVRSQADGSHYTSTDELPLVPGIDGVGRGADGLLRYFILPDTTLGAMAEQTLIDTRRSIVLPEDSDPIAVAAAMNPAMSAWVALRQRVRFQPGQNVLVLGATGSAGQMAVQVAKLFGADQIIAAGRCAGRLAGLPALGATDTVLLGGDAASVAQRLGRAAAEVDVVIDYLWGQPTAAAMVAVVTDRADRGKRSPGSRSLGRRTHRVGPVGRAARRPPSDRRQRTRLRQHPRNPHRTARTRSGDHQRNFRDRSAAHATHPGRTGLGRRRPHDTAHRSHPTVLDLRETSRRTTRRFAPAKLQACHSLGLGLYGLVCAGRRDLVVGWVVAGGDGHGRAAGCRVVRTAPAAP